MQLADLIGRYAAELIAVAVSILTIWLANLPSGHRRRATAANAALAAGVGLSQNPDPAAWLEFLPFPAWFRDGSEAAPKTNEVCRELNFDPATADLGGPCRVQIAASGRTRWFDVVQVARPEGTFAFALSADAAQQAESTLQRMMETLSQTFAQFSTGVAIFDRNRDLVLFNPALADILALDPVWLAKRPQLRDFLEKLRENRKVPDVRDFLEWKRMLSDLLENAAVDIYRETWLLPSGQALRVSGRPHPQGSLAFLFEDISLVTNLQRLYRGTENLNRAILRRLNEGIAVFDTMGNLVCENPALRGIWRRQDADPEQPGDIKTLSAHWRALCHPSPVWGELRDFITGQTVREAWNADVLTLDGRSITCNFAPLPDGSTLAVFEERGASADQIPELKSAASR